MGPDWCWHGRRKVYLFPLLTVTAQVVTANLALLINKILGKVVTPDEISQLLPRRWALPLCINQQIEELPRVVGNTKVYPPSLIRWVRRPRLPIHGNLEKHCHRFID